MAAMHLSTAGLTTRVHRPAALSARVTVTLAASRPSLKAGRSMRLQVRAADDGIEEMDIEDLESRLAGKKGNTSNYSSGGTRNLNKATSLAEDRNRARREASGAYFASPNDGPPAETQEPKSKGPFGLDVQPDPFVKPDNWDTMGALQKAWTVWAEEGGVLPNINKFATGSSVVMGILWILFRFVGPTLGLYDLEASLTDAPNIGI